MDAFGRPALRRRHGSDVGDTFKWILSEDQVSKVVELALQVTANRGTREKGTLDDSSLSLTNRPGRLHPTIRFRAAGHLVVVVIVNENEWKNASQNFRDREKLRHRCEIHMMILCT